MTEKTLITLLTRLAYQLIELHDKEGKLERRSEFATRLAQATWDGLVFMLRQSIASKETVVLEDLGIFKYDGESCVFVPSASLSEAEAINQPAAEAQVRVAKRAMFYLDQGAKILSALPHDIQVPASTSIVPSGGMDEALMSLVYEMSFDNQNQSALSFEIRKLAGELMVTAAHLDATQSERASGDDAPADTATEATSNALPEYAPSPIDILRAIGNGVDRDSRRNETLAEAEAEASE